MFLKKNNIIALLPAILLASVGHGQDKSLTIAQNGTAKAVIVVAADASEPENHAAGELARFRSVFFEKMEKVLGGRQDIQRVGDRFVFQSEVLFAVGSAEIGAEGQAELAKLGEVLREVVDEMPEDLNWILRIDGHTDKTPIGGRGRYRDNWELSQGRALSVVKYLVEKENVPPARLAAGPMGLGGAALFLPRRRDGKIRSMDPRKNPKPPTLEPEAAQPAGPRTNPLR